MTYTIEQLKKLSDAATSGPWKGCGKHQDCQCASVWCEDHPIADVTSGKWGDPYPALRIVGGPLDQKVVPYMEILEYGEVPREQSIANVRFIAAARTAIPELIEEVKSLQCNISRVAQRCAEIMDAENASGAGGKTIRAEFGL